MAHFCLETKKLQHVDWTCLFNGLKASALQAQPLITTDILLLLLYFFFLDNNLHVITLTTLSIVALCEKWGTYVSCQLGWIVRRYELLTCLRWNKCQILRDICAGYKQIWGLSTHAAKKWPRNFANQPCMFTVLTSDGTDAQNDVDVEVRLLHRNEALHLVHRAL